MFCVFALPTTSFQRLGASVASWVFVEASWAFVGASVASACCHQREVKTCGTTRVLQVPQFPCHFNCNKIKLISVTPLAIFKPRAKFDVSTIL